MAADSPALGTLQSAINTVNDELPSVLCSDSPAVLYDTVHDVLASAGLPLFGGVTLTVTEALGGRNASKRALPVAVALEAVRLQGIIHTDHPLASSTQKYLDTSDVLAGDALYAGAVETILSVDMPCSRRQRALETIVTTARETSEGRAQRDQYERRDDVSVSSYLSVVEQTTGNIGAAAGRLGALTVGADKPLIVDAAAYGRALGVAIGVYEDASAILPDLPSLYRADPVTPVQTLATIHARENGVPVDRLQLFEHDIDRLVEKLTQTGSIAYTTRELRNKARTAKAALASFPDSSVTDDLRTLAEVPVNRFN
jgi:geranylgeranyl pyrophosphate synthase